MSPLQAGNETVEAAGASSLLLHALSAALLLLLALGATWVLRRGHHEVHKPTMTTLEHIEELRRRVLVVLAVWLAGSMVAFSFRYTTTSGGIPILEPALTDNLAAQLFHVVTRHLVPAGVTLVVTRPIDGFLAELYLALGIGFLIALPVLMVQAGRFLGPALRERERRALGKAFLPALLLFLAGIAFAWAFVLPFILETLYGYSAALGAQSLLQISDLVGFAVTMSLVFGLAFQTPLLMYLLARGGAVSSGSFLRKWRIAVVVIVIFSAVVTDPTIVSQMLVAGPLIALYFIGVAAAHWGTRASSDA